MSDVAERIARFNKNRLPSVLPRKYDAMSVDAFRFFRGSNHLFYEDLHKLPLFGKHPAIWICGDLHIENFGSFRGDNKLVYFDINDFDEAVLAPFTWDVARMTTSILVAAKMLGIDGLSARKLANLFLNSYFHCLKTGKSKHVETKIAKGILHSFLEKVQNRKMKMLIRERTMSNGQRLRIDNVKQLLLDEDDREKTVQALERWMVRAKDVRYHYHIVDAAFRIAGTGSLGVKRYVLLAKNDEKKTVLIDIKQATPPSSLRWIKTPQPEWSSDAERVVWTQTMLQSTPPALLTNYQYEKEWYVLKMLQPSEDKIDYSKLNADMLALELLMANMGTLTASAHLRTTGRKGSCTADALMEAAANNDLKKEILSTATDYCAQTMSYYKDFTTAYKSGFFGH